MLPPRAAQSGKKGIILHRCFPLWCPADVSCICYISFIFVYDRKSLKDTFRGDAVVLMTRALDLGHCNIVLNVLNIYIYLY